MECLHFEIYKKKDWNHFYFLHVQSIFFLKSDILKIISEKNWRLGIFFPLKYLSIKELSNELGSVRFDFICTAHFYFIWTLSRNRFIEICITGDAQKDPLQFT